MSSSSEKQFITMLENYKAIVYKIANLYGKTAEDRKDLFQDIIINLWKAYPAFKAQAKEST